MASPRCRIATSGIAANKSNPNSLGNASRKVDVAGQARFARALKKVQEMPAFGLPRSTAIDDNDTRFGRCACQFQEILPVAGHHNGLCSDGMMPDVHIVSSHAQDFRDQRNLMAGL